MYKTLIVINILYSVLNGVLSSFKYYFSFPISINIVGILLFICMIGASFISNKRVKFTTIDVAVICVFILMLLNSVITTRVNLIQHYDIAIPRIINPFLQYFIWKTAFSVLDDDYIIKKLYLVLSFSILGILLYYTLSGGVERIQNVLQISDTLAFIGIIVIYKKKNISLFIITVLLLLMLKSFTSIVFFITIISVGVVYNLAKRNRKIKIRITRIFISITTIVMIGSTLLIANKKTNYLSHVLNLVIVRFENVIHGNDLSLIARKELSNIGLQVLRDNYFLGEFLYEIRIFNSFGHYMHNFLSFWIEFGMIPFLITIILIIKMLSFFIKMTIKEKEKYFSYLLASTFVVATITFSRSYIYTTIWSCIGLYSALLLEESKRTKNVSKQQKF